MVTGEKHAFLQYYYSQAYFLKGHYNFNKHNVVTQSIHWMGQPWKQTGVEKTNSFSPNIPKTAVLIKLFYELKSINYKTN